MDLDLSQHSFISTGQPQKASLAIMYRRQSPPYPKEKHHSQQSSLAHIKAQHDVQGDINENNEIGPLM